jgi:hypothetical protein
MERLDIETAQRFEAAENALMEKFEARVNDLGRLAAKAFPAPEKGKGPSDKGKSPSDKGKSQLNNLERIGLSAPRFGDVVAFVKRQTGRQGEWRNTADGGKALGPELVKWLGELHGAVDETCGDPALAPHRQRLGLRVVGTSLRNLNSAFLYERVVAHKP